MKTFYQILGNTLVASVINFTVWFAITFYVYLQTRSVFATAIIAGIYLVATAISGFWFGSLVDRFKNKQVMIFSSVASLVLFIISFGIYITAGQEAFQDPFSWILWVFVVILMAGVIAGNIRTIALPTIVTILFPPENRDKANGLSGTANGIGFLITSVISGILVGHSGMYLVLLLAIGAMIGSIVHLMLISIPEKNVVHTRENNQHNIDIRGTLKVISGIPGFFALIFFTTFNNFLGGVFMALMDAYGLSLVSVQVWGLIWGFLSTGFIIGGLIIAKFGLGKNPLKAMFLANLIIWVISAVFTIQPWVALLVAGMFIYLCVIPFIEATEQTIIQKVVPHERQGRVFGFAQSMEQAASPLTAFLIGPIAQFIFIPFMTTGAGVELIGDWFGVGPDRGIALVFTLTGIIGICVTLIAMNSKQAKMLSKRYLEG
jgi:MFS transporter, DHA3 family, multidrug efflux protein